MKTYSSAAASGVERKIRIACPVCDKTRFRPFYLLRECSFVRCLDCGLVCQNPQPRFEDLRERYARAYFEYEIENEENFYRLMRLGLSDIGLDDAFFERAADKTFLDVGCATGMLLAAMQRLGLKVQGVEICAESALYARERLVPVFVGPLEEAGFPDASFSFIHFSHLIEHVPDPYRFLLEARRLLAPDGCAVITTPNIDGLQARLFGPGWRSAIADHLFLFSRRTFARLLKRAGFVVRRTVTWGGLAAGRAPGWLKRPADFLAKRFGFGDVMLFLVGKNEAAH